MSKNQAEADLFSNLDYVLNKINILQKELISIVSKEGFNSIKTITASQELDVYIMKYYMVKNQIHNLSLHK